MESNSILDDRALLPTNLCGVVANGVNHQTARPNPNIATGSVFGGQVNWKHAQEKSSVEWNVRVKNLRHFFGSTMLNRGVDSLEIATQMGHQDVNMLRERYGHHTDEKLHNSSKVWDYSEVNKSQLGANSKSW